MTNLRPFKFRVAESVKANENDTATNCVVCLSKSVVAEGDDAGLTFGELAEKYKADFVGEAMWEKFGTNCACDLKVTDTLVVDDTYDMYFHEPHPFKVLVCTKGWVVATDNTGREMRVEEGDAVVIPAASTLVVLDSYADFLVADPV